MKISELIKELELVLEKDGDLQVVVQYRDEGGSYHGQDESLDLAVSEGKLVL